MPLFTSDHLNLSSRSRETLASLYQYQDEKAETTAAVSHERITHLNLSPAGVSPDNRLAANSRSSGVRNDAVDKLVASNR